MSFREKIMWPTLLVGILPYLWYFGSVFVGLVGGPGGMAPSLGTLLATVIWGTIVLAIVVSAIAIFNRNEGTMLPDERELSIERKGIAFSYHLLCTGILAVIVAAWYGISVTAVIHALALVFVIAEFARVAIEIRCLRRGY